MHYWPNDCDCSSCARHPTEDGAVVNCPGKRDVEWGEGRKTGHTNHVGMARWEVAEDRFGKLNKDVKAHCEGTALWLYLRTIEVLGFDFPLILPIGNTHLLVLRLALDGVHHVAAPLYSRSMSSLPFPPYDLLQPPPVGCKIPLHLRHAFPSSVSASGQISSVAYLQLQCNKAKIDQVPTLR